MFDTLKVIHGLVTRGSSKQTKHVSPHRRAGLTKLRVSGLAAPKWQPSLSPFTYEGFCVCRTQITPQSGLANRPMSGPYSRNRWRFNRPPAPWPFAGTTKTGNVDRQARLTHARVPDSLNARFSQQEASRLPEGIHRAPRWGCRVPRGSSMPEKLIRRIMNELALFAGAGGGLLASHLLGHRTICAVEWDAYAASVLVARQNDGSLPPFPIWDDVRTFDGRPWRHIVDIVSGGFPCQAYSTAASGRNVADDLWPEMRRIVADVAPRYVFAENVSKRAINRAADDCEEMGYQTRCLSLSAKDLGGDHIRERHWLLAYADMHGELHGTQHAEVAVRSSIYPRVWLTKPDEPRMADGMAHRVERLISTGNGQVPAVAATAWRILLKNMDTAK